MIEIYPLELMIDIGVIASNPSLFGFSKLPRHRMANGLLGLRLNTSFNQAQYSSSVARMDTTRQEYVSEITASRNLKCS